MDSLKENQQIIDKVTIRVLEQCAGDEVMTYVYLVEPHLKSSVETLLRESCDKKRLADHLCNHFILEAEDCYV